jgi:ribonuclease BN (tRNA processing enzyme)
MPIKVTILGSGTAVPSLERSSCSVLMETGSACVLFDIGAGTIRRLLEAGRKISDITHIFITHFHTDHTGELASFLFSTKYPETLRRRTPFMLAGARGLRSFYEALMGAYGHWIELPPELLSVMELSDTEKDFADLGQFNIETLPMRHISSSIGYRLTAPDGCCAVYTGDTDYTENAIELGRAADLMICESAMPDNQKIEMHLTPSLAGELAAKAGVKKLVLTHFYPEAQSTDIDAECRKTYLGPLVLARDLMSFFIKLE